MHIGIDIDGTIAGRNLKAFAAACDAQFGLGFGSEPPSTYASLMAHPIMQAHRQASSEQFEATITRLEQAPEMLRVLPTL